MKLGWYAVLKDKSILSTKNLKVGLTFSSFSKSPFSVTVILSWSSCRLNRSEETSRGSDAHLLHLHPPHCKAFWRILHINIGVLELKSLFYFRKLLFDGFSLQECWLWVKWNVISASARAAGRNPPPTQITSVFQLKHGRRREDEFWSSTEKQTGEFASDEVTRGHQHLEGRTLTIIIIITFKLHFYIQYFGIRSQAIMLSGWI